MVNNNEKIFKDLHRQLDVMGNDEKLYANLHKTLINSSESTDYDGWENGCVDFIKDNPNLLEI